MAELEYHRKYRVITAMEGRQLVAEQVLPEFGPKMARATELYGVLHGLVAGLDSYEFDDLGVAEPLRVARALLAEIDGEAP